MLVLAQSSYTIDLEILVIKFSCFNFSHKNHFHGLGHLRKFLDGIKSILHSQVCLSDLERDYACQKYEQLAAFVAITQLLVNYTHAKEKQRLL